MSIDSIPTAAPGPLNIVHYLPAIRLRDGGVVRAVLDWCGVFAGRGHQITLLTLDGHDVPKEWLGGESGKPRAIIFPGKLHLNAVKAATQAIEHADVLHLHAPWLAGNHALAKIARRQHVPYLVTVHGMLDDWSMSQKSLKKRIYMALAGRRFLDAAACIHCSAEAELAQASKWFANPHTAVLPNLVDLKPFEVLPGPEAGLSLVPEPLRQQPKILFLSRLHEKKGVDILIRAAAKLRDAQQPVALLIAGAGEPSYRAHLGALVAELKLEAQVCFLDLVTGTPKTSLYQAADLFVLPTLQENFGLVLAEALACATPVITTKGTDIWREVEQAGGLIADRTPDAIAAAISQLLADPASRASRGERGRKWAMETLAVEPLAQRYESLYRQLGK